MPSTFRAVNFSNSKSEEDELTINPCRDAPSVTLAFIGCPSSHTEISLNFEASQSSAETAGIDDVLGSNVNAKCGRNNSSPRVLMPIKSPTSLQRTPEQNAKPAKKQTDKSQACKIGEHSTRSKDACCGKNTSLVRGEVLGKSGNDERVSPVFGNASKPRDKSPRRATSLHKHTSSEASNTPQRKLSKERSGEIKAISRLRACLKGLKQKSQTGNLTENELNTIQHLEQNSRMQRQIRLPKAQGDMEISSKEAPGHAKISGSLLDSDNVGNLNNYPECSDNCINATAEPCQSHQRSRTKGYPTIDRMFVDVLKTLIIQSGPDSSPGVTSIYDVNVGQENFSYDTTCNFKMESEIGKSNNAAAAPCCSGESCGDRQFNEDFTHAHECFLGDRQGTGFNPGETTICTENKNCNHSIVDDYEDEALVGPLSTSDSSEDMYDAYDELYQEVDIPGCQTDVMFRSIEETVHLQILCNNVSGFHVTNYAEANRDVVVYDAAFNGPTHFIDINANFLNTEIDIGSSKNRNNSLNDEGTSDVNYKKATNAEKQQTHVRVSKESAKVNVSREFQLNDEPSTFANYGFQEGILGDEISVKITPPSPLMSSNSSGSDSIIDDFLSVPEVFMSLRASMPAESEMFRTTEATKANTEEQEQEDLYNASGGRGAFGFTFRSNSSKTTQRFITSYIETAREIIKRAKARSMSPNNVFAKINKFCGKGKEEIKLIKSWSFSGVVSLVDRAGAYTCANKNKVDSFKMKWTGLQSDEVSILNNDDTPKAQHSNVSPSVGLLLPCYNKSDMIYGSVGESLHIQGSSRSYATHPSESYESNCVTNERRGGVQQKKPDGQFQEFCKSKLSFREYAGHSPELMRKDWPLNSNTELSTAADESSPSVPVKSQSLLQVSGTVQGESRLCKNVMAMLSEEVTIKRYPSFTDLTDLNGEMEPRAQTSFKNNTEPIEGNCDFKTNTVCVKKSQTVTAASNAAPLDNCIDKKSRKVKIAEAETPKITPPNSPNLGFFAGKKVHTIVSLLESCSALRTDNDNLLAHPANDGSHLKSTNASFENDTVGCQPFVNTERCTELLKLPSPPLSSPSDSSGDTLDDIHSPADTLETFLASTSKSASTYQRPIMKSIKIVSSNSSHGSLERIRDKKTTEILHNPDGSSVAVIYSEKLPDNDSDDLSSETRRRCGETKELNGKEGDSLSISVSDTETPSMSISDDFEKPRVENRVEKLRKLKPKSPKSFTGSKNTPNISQVCRKTPVPKTGTGRVEKAASPKASSKNPQPSEGIKNEDAKRTKYPRKIKWVTDSVSEEDSTRASSSSSNISDHVVQVADDSCRRNYSIMSTNEIIGNNVQSKSACTMSKEKSTDPGTEDAKKEEGSKSDSNNNVALPIKNRWLRLHCGIPRNFKMKTKEHVDPEPRVTSKKHKKRKHGSEDKTHRESSNCELLCSHSFKLMDAFDNNKDLIKNDFSLSQASEINGVSDTEDNLLMTVNKKRNVSVKYHESSEIASDCYVDGHYPFQRTKHENVDSIRVRGKPYRQVRKEETFTSDPRKDTASKNHVMRPSQSFQLHNGAMSALPPRPFRGSNLVRPYKPCKRNGTTNSVFFEETSPDVSRSDKASGRVMGEMCVVPKVGKNFWEEASTLHGREATKVQSLTSPIIPSRFRLNRTDVNTPNAKDFVKRSNFHLDRCDKMIEKSITTIRTSQKMVERSKKRIADTAAEMRRLGCI